MTKGILVNIVSRTDWVPVRCQAIIWTNADLLKTEPLEKISVKFQSKCIFQENASKMSSVKCQPCCPCLNAFRSFAYRTLMFAMQKITRALLRCTLQWRHYGRVSISNHQPHGCLLKRLFKAQIKENIKVPSHWALCWEFTVDRWIPRIKGQ